MPNINKNIIMQAGAAVANATNKAAGLSASTPEPGSIISAIQLVNGGRTIGPAALAHFTESVRNKLLSLLVSMEPIQDFNGYDHPWPAGGGVNKLDLSVCTFIDCTLVNADLGSVQCNMTNKYMARIDLAKAVFPSGLEQRIINGDPISFIADNNVGYGIAIVINGTRSDSTTFQEFTASDWRVTANPTLFTDVTSIQLRFRRKGTAYTDTTTVVPGLRLTYGSTDVDFSPYSNICPISGRMGVNVYAGPSDSIGDATTYSMDWTTPAGTVYAGSADVVSGDIKAAPEYASYNGETLVGPWVSSMDVYDPTGTPTTGAQVVDLGGTMTEYHITGQDIITLVGDNYIWSDSGDVTITE